MNAFLARSESKPAATEPAVTAVRGDAFFVRRLELPAGTSEPEVAGFVALQLEELSPFPLEQLYHGHVCSSDRRAVIVYAAYRRRLPVEQTEKWANAGYVLPDFAGALRQKFPSTTVVYLHSGDVMSALYFEADHELPLRVASRPLAADAPPDAVERVRQQVHALVDGGSARELFLRPRGEPERRAKGLQFIFEPVGGGDPREVFIPGNECWTMDVRDSAFIAEQRRRLGHDLVLWRIVLGTAAAMALLLVGEILLGASQAFSSWLARRNEAQAPAVARIRERDDATMRLEEFAVSGVQPFDMLRAVGQLKPESAHLTRSTAKAGSVLEIEGWAPDVASINSFENDLRSAPTVEAVEVRRVNTNTGGSTFSFAVTFRSGSFNRVEAAQR